MSTRREELENLLVQRATDGLDARDTVRLNQLLAEFPEVDEGWADRLVGELDAATADDAGVRLDGELRQALLAAAPPGRGSPRPASPVWSWGGWMVAAAVAGLWLVSPGAGPDGAEGPVAGPPAGAEQTAQGERAPERPPAFGQVAARSDAVVASWAPASDPTGSQVSGEVVWSSQAQAGVMRLRGLEVNPPAEYQYQLWIFDRNRDERYPVDGGVFDMPGGAPEAEIPIRAKLPVDEAVLFAVTVERPGGVVVSDRERLATVAEVTALGD